MGECWHRFLCSSQALSLLTLVFVWFNISLFWLEQNRNLFQLRYFPVALQCLAGGREGRIEAVQWFLLSAGRRLADVQISGYISGPKPKGESDKGPTPPPRRAAPGKLVLTLTLLL